MVQSVAIGPGGLHVAIIMDGNGRWAQNRGLPRSVGHRAGATAVRRVVEAAPKCGIEVLTLYAFSSDNWQRPALEVHALLQLLENYLRKELASCIENGVSVEVLGRRDRLPARVREAIETAERETAEGRMLRLRLAIDYSSREALMRAAAHGPCTQEELARYLNPLTERRVPNVDLLIRSGGEQRLSDFLLWESAYAELYFTEVAWPDFDDESLAAAVKEFSRRQRRFGAVDGEASATAQSSASVR